ncbi:MAG TPA: DNA polymerase III subunit gamma/tau [Bacteroidota bacterium]|nr:DNA polymerase III subunit gamma/tau [Bacteroidota bacterium]
MSYLVTARKWRPMIFDDIIGQSHISTTLRNAIATHRLSHAYIFSGPRGVGKTTAARILAKAINCTSPKDQNPDNTCDLCREITEGRSVNVFEIDGASNRGVDEIRNLREAVRYGPAKGKYKVYIIDEVHMLTKEAFNALLKTLEEPPSYVVFIFATTEIHKVPLTILSRCQRFDFRRISIDEIVGRLRHIAGEEHITIDDDALLIIAKRADGSMRDAQSIFDQVVSFCGEKISAKQILSMLNIVDEEMFFRVSALMKARDVKGGLLLVEEVVNGGFDLREFLSGLTEHFRNLLVVRSTGATNLIETSEYYKQKYQETATAFSESDLLRLIRLAGETESALRWSPQPRLKLELGLMQMIKLDGSVEISQLLRQLEEIKKKETSISGESSAGKFGSPSLAPRMFRQESSEAPVRGSVKASQPTLRADQVVTRPMPPFEPRKSPSLQEVDLESTALRSPFPQPPVSVLSAGDAAGKWGTFLDAVRKERIAVGTMLSEANLLDVRNNMLRIGCPDDFHLDGLRRNRTFLQDIAERIYGARVQLETIIDRHRSNASETDKPEQTATASSPGTAHGSDVYSSPIVRAIIREFDAKVIG